MPGPVRATPGPVDRDAADRRGAASFTPRDRRAQVARPAPLPAPLDDDAELQAVAEGASASRSSPTARSRARTCACYVTPRPDELAIFVARPLTEVDHALGTLRWALGLLALAGIALAVRALAARDAHRDPPGRRADRRPPSTSPPRATSRAGSRRRARTRSRAWRPSFNTMLEALERSQRAQRQLVADASHELRTPLTSLRTNLEVLARGGPLDPGDRDRLRADLVAQLEELTALVGDLVELARDEEPEAPQVEDVRLDRLVAAAVERARRHAPARHVRDRAGAGARRRASPRGWTARSRNLLDNAAKWSPPGAVVDVRLRDGELTVRDRGPGIPDDDRAHVFDRFFRADAARGRPGLRARAGDRAPGGRGARRDGRRGGRRRRRRAAAPAPAGPLSKSLGSAEGGLIPARRRWRA